MPFDNPITGGQGALVRPRIKSPDYIPGVQGWSINKDGSAEFNNVTVRGELFVTDPDGSYVHIFNEDPGDGSLIELRLPNSAGAVIVPARIRSGTTPHFTDPGLEVLGPNVNNHGTAAIYLASGPTGGGVLEVHADDYAWFDTNGCSWVVAGDWELAHETTPGNYAIHFQVWVDGTVIAGAMEADSLIVRPGGSIDVQGGGVDASGTVDGGDLAVNGVSIGRGIVGTPATTSSAGTATTSGSATPVRDAVLGNYSVSLVAGRQYRVVYDGLKLGLSASTATLSTCRIYRRTGTGNPTTADTALTESAIRLTTGGGPGQESLFVSLPFTVPASGTYTFAAFTINGLATAVAITPVADRALYVLDMG